MTTRSIADEFIEVMGMINRITDDVTNDTPYRYSVRITQQAAWNVMSNAIREAREICHIASAIKMDAREGQQP